MWENFKWNMQETAINKIKAFSHLFLFRLFRILAVFVLPLRPNVHVQSANSNFIHFNFSDSTAKQHEQMTQKLSGFTSFRPINANSFT